MDMGSAGSRHLEYGIGADQQQTPDRFAPAPATAFLQALTRIEIWTRVGSGDDGVILGFRPVVAALGVKLVHAGEPGGLVRAHAAEKVVYPVVGTAAGGHGIVAEAGNRELHIREKGGDVIIERRGLPLQGLDIVPMGSGVILQ